MHLDLQESRTIITSQRNELIKIRYGLYLARSLAESHITIIIYDKIGLYKSIRSTRLAFFNDGGASARSETVNTMIHHGSGYDRIKSREHHWRRREEG